LELLETGELSEGHGRAILQVQGNDSRRRLARDAAAGGWSVRETESRAKLASQPSRGKRAVGGRAALDPEIADALDDAESKLESALGHAVKVGVRGKQIHAEIRFEDIDELLELARRIKLRKAA
jgi:ParB family chromosome partitioning protein